MSTLSGVSYLALVTALLISLGGVWALLRQQVVVDANGQPTEIELPFFGKMKTNYPSLVAVLIGAALTSWVVNRIPVEFDKIPLNVDLAVSDAFRNNGLVVGAIPLRYMRAGTQLASEGGSLTLNVDRPDTYNVVAFVVSGVSPDGRLTYELTHGPTEVVAEPASFHFKGRLGQ
ncbi:hypothetical protein [Frigidibacter oleivorans]|uniref:hypothetical protein n=1 Tax=Frigidibacter oleivorans TaxID=2487129 RepID=UPI000F8EEE92|nr:hypothetical protein [Frigidibacter oleivorans]